MRVGGGGGVGWEGRKNADKRGEKLIEGNSRMREKGMEGKEG